jgi:hypothetical protein
MGSNRAHFDAGDTPSAREDAATKVSRRQVLRRSAVALGGIAGLGLLDPSSVFGSAQTRFGSATAAPRPIPGGFSLAANDYVPSGADFHFLLPGIGFEMSTITDFDGVVGGSETRGTARGSDGTSYSFDCDMRFMQGLYVGLDGRRHFGSFGFI